MQIRHDPHPLEATPIHSLAEHRTALPSDCTLEDAHARLQHQPHGYAAILQHDRYLGLLDRDQVQRMLAQRFGFPLFAKKPVWRFMLPAPLVASPAWPLLDLLQAALGRTAGRFHQDIPLVDEEGRFQGMLTTRRLVKAQSDLVNAQMERILNQRLALGEANRKLEEGLRSLQREKARTEILFEHSPIGIGLVDRTGRLKVANPNLRQWLGAHPEGEVSLLDALAPDVRQDFLDRLQGHLPETCPLPLEASLHAPRHSGGSTFPRHVRIHLEPVADARQVVATLVDVTAQREAEQRIAQEEKAALLSTMLGGIAHEMNNKLSPVVGFADLLQWRLKTLPETRDLQEYCRLVRTSAIESVSLVRQLLHVSRPPALERHPWDLGALVQDTCLLTNFRRRQLGVRFQLNLPDCPIHLMVDGPQLKQVILNVLINALDAMEAASQRRLTVTVRRDTHDALVEVQDTGIGIAPEHLDRLYDPFFTTKGPTKGTGLGLSVSQRIVQQHGGRLHIGGIPEGGTLVTLRLPDPTAAAPSASV